MKQQYFVTVRTTGPYNANKSTRELCSLISQQLDNTTIPSLADIDRVREYLQATCNDINAKYQRNKKLKVENPWITSYANEVYKSHHIVVRIDNCTNGDGGFLQLDFTPTRHAYGETMLNELFGEPNHVTAKPKRPRYKPWNPEKAQDGDIICEEDDNDEGDIILVKGIRNQGILFHAVYDKVLMLGLNLNNSPVTIDCMRHYYRYATEEERNLLFNELSVRGLRYNPMTLQLEKIE